MPEASAAVPAFKKSRRVVVMEVSSILFLLTWPATRHVRLEGSVRHGTGNSQFASELDEKRFREGGLACLLHFCSNRGAQGSCVDDSKNPLP
jgi:hypothetical protein